MIKISFIEIRNLILNSKTSFNKKTDLLLYQAARSENINNIKKNYKKKIILVDRFTDYTIAYQHFDFGLNHKMIKNLNKYIDKKKYILYITIKYTI